MLRSILTLSALLLTSVPAAATTYSATLGTPTNQRIMAPDIAWACGAGACRGVTEESRPTIICQSLARRAGKVGSFLVDGRPFTQNELDQCNSAAKAPGGGQLAAH
jgi:hypothetical protein